MRAEIEARAPQGLQAATDAVTLAVAAESDAGPIEAPLQAIMVTAQK